MKSAAPCSVRSSSSLQLLLRHGFVSHRFGIARDLARRQTAKRGQTATLEKGSMVPSVDCTMDRYGTAGLGELREILACNRATRGEADSTVRDAAILRLSIAKHLIFFGSMQRPTS